jgi:hypothetical protein
MVRGRSPLNPPVAPDIRSSDESESNISPDALGAADETDEQRAAGQKRNRLRAGRRRRAQQRKAARATYEAELEEYNRRQMAREAEDEQNAQHEERRRAREDRDQRIAGVSRDLEPEFMMVRGQKIYTTPYANELAAIPNPNPEQDVLQSTALQLQGRNLHSLQNPSRATSHQGSQSQRVSAHDRLGPDGARRQSQGGHNRVEQGQGYQGGRGSDDRNQGHQFTRSLITRRVIIDRKVELSLSTEALRLLTVFLVLLHGCFP